jgi:hypothetical protein
MNTMNTVENITMKKMVRNSRQKLYEITNNDIRTTLGVKLDLAEKKENVNEIKKIYAEISFVCMQNPVEENKKSVLYETPPSFDQAVIDFLNLNIPDLIRLPEQDEFIGYINAPVDEKPVNSLSRKGSKSGNNRSINKNVSNIEFLIETEIPKRKMLQTIGSTQTQKTNYQIGIAIKSLLKGITPVMITRDFIGDASQLEKRINDFSKKLEDYLHNSNVTERLFKIKVARADKLSSFDRQSIIVCLGNESQIPKVINMIKKNTSTNFIPKINVIIDENDKVDYSLGTKTYTALAELKYISHQTFGITATPLDVLALQDDLKSNDVFILTNPKDYRGHLDITVKLQEIDEKVKGINRVATYDEVIEHDKNFAYFLSEYSKSQPEYVWSIRQHLPNICLIKVTNINATQDALFDGIYDNYENKFALIIMHEKGIKMKFKGMKDCIIDGKDVKPDTFMKDIDLPDWFQYLKNNGGVKRFPRILVISGYKAERCISFVSRDYAWHLTDMYYNPASKTSIPTMWQETGRLTGRNKGKSHLHLHCTKRVADSLYNGINFTNEAITRGIENPFFLKGEEQTLFESIKNVTMLNKKFPKYRNIVTKAPVKRKDFKLVRKNDGGKSLENYKYNTDELDEFEDCEADAEEKEVIDDSDKLKKVKEAYNKQGSIVNKIINKFIDNNFSYLSKNELDVTNIANYDRWNLGKSAQYNIIEKTENGLYKLRNDVKIFLEL